MFKKVKFNLIILLIPCINVLQKTIKVDLLFMEEFTNPLSETWE